MEVLNTPLAPSGDFYVEIKFRVKPWASPPVPNALTGKQEDNLIADIASYERWYDGLDDSTITGTGTVSAWTDRTANEKNGVVPGNENAPGRVPGGVHFTDTNEEALYIPFLPESCTVFLAVDVDPVQVNGRFSFLGSYILPVFLPFAQDSSSNTAVYESVGTPQMEINGVAQDPGDRDEMHALFAGQGPLIVKFTNVVGVNQDGDAGIDRLGRGRTTSYYHGTIMGMIVIETAQSSQALEQRVLDGMISRYL